MNKKYNIAIVGATGAVGQMMIKILMERKFPINNLYLLASNKSDGKIIKIDGIDYKVKSLDAFDFKKVDIAMFSAGSHVSEKYASIATKNNAVVIDNTSFFRYKDNIPLVVPEVNSDKISEYKETGIIANPNCSTIQMLVARKPIHDICRIKRINVCTYQAVSGSGNIAIEELKNQVNAYVKKEKLINEVYPKQIAFNVIPQIDKFMDNGYTKEEMKMVWETKKILDTKIEVNPTTVRVPVFFGHSEAVHLELEEKITADEVKSILGAKNSGVVLVDDHKDGGYPCAANECEESNDVFVGRVREDISTKYGINMWVVSNNIRKGAAYNSVQIAELLIKDYL
jgi:aspartate-semialdehyde dehydrogenase